MADTTLKLDKETHVDATEKPEVKEAEVEEAKEPKDAHAPALANTVPSYTEPKSYTVDLPAATKPEDQADATDVERDSLLNRLAAALDAAPDDVTALLEARLAHLVYEAESRVPGLVK